MAVPDYQSLMKPVLDALADGSEWHVRRELVPIISKQLDLSDGDLAETIQSGMPKIQSRGMWAVTYLVQAGAISRSRDRAFGSDSLIASTTARRSMPLKPRTWP